MRILQVIHGYPMRYNAGSEVYTQGLAQALADRGASTGLVYDCSSTCPARNWRFAVVGAGFEEVELLDTSGSGEIGVLGVLLDAVDFEGPERSFCGPVSRRVRLGWRSGPLPSTERALVVHFPRRAGEGLRAPVAMVVSPRPERAGQADQDGRPSGAALPVVDLSVIRGVGSSTVVRGSVGSYRPVIAGAKLREGTTTILPRGRALQGVGLSSMRFHPIGGGPKTTKMDKKHGSRQESHPLLDRPEIDWPCRN